MINILCYGDSNTYGFNPENGTRFDANTRWTGVLGKLLGSSFSVIEAGMNNRTGFFDNPDGIAQSGAKHLPECLKNCDKIDICVLGLGANDLQFIFDINEDVVEKGLKRLISHIKEYSKEAEIILVTPPILFKNLLDGYFACQFDEKSIENSKKIKPIYKKVAENENCNLIEIDKFVTPSESDGLHFSAESHKIIGKVIAEKITQITSSD